MTRRADPERIYQARRVATFGKLTQTGAIDELEAEHRTPRGSAPAFCERGDAWIASQRWR